MKMDRTVEGPGGREMDVKKTTDFDTGTRTTERKTSGGGSSEVTASARRAAAIASGSFETAGGKGGTIEGDHQRGQGFYDHHGRGRRNLDGRQGAQPGRQRFARRVFLEGRAVRQHRDAARWHFERDESRRKRRRAGHFRFHGPWRAHDDCAEWQRRPLRRPRRQRLPQDRRRLAAAR